LNILNFLNFLNILTLNVLITIVGEGYGLAQSMQHELNRVQQAGTITDLEDTYLRPYLGTNVVRRGKPCCLIRYPGWLTRFSCGTPSLMLTMGNAEDDGSDKKNLQEGEWAQTERALLKTIGDATEKQLSGLTGLVKEQKEQIERLENCLLGSMVAATPAGRREGGFARSETTSSYHGINGVGPTAAASSSTGVPPQRKIVPPSPSPADAEPRQACRFGL